MKELIGRKMDALAGLFHDRHNIEVKEQIDRLAKDYGKLKEPWLFVAN